MLKIYSDGASRGNPGLSAIAFIILDGNGEILRQDARLLGIRTNNQAEYEALISALEDALALDSGEVTCHSDSTLVVKHLKGEWKIEKRELKELWRKVMALKTRFDMVHFVWVPRTDKHIRLVDSMVNQLLDNSISCQ